MSFNPKSRAVSVDYHGLSFTDPTLLGTLAKGWGRDLSEAAGLIFSGKKEFDAPVINAPSFPVSIGSHKEDVTIEAVKFSAGLTVEKGAPKAEVEATTGFRIASPEGKSVDVTYSVTTSYTWQGRPHIPPPSAQEIEVLIVAAAFVFGARVFAGGLPGYANR